MAATTGTSLTINILLFLFSVLFTTTTSTTHHRHLLHQPFFPLTTIPPTQPPSLSPQPQPKYPFTSTPNNNHNNPQKPFFPTLPSPPPPPPSTSTLATFPANISSLLFPHHSSSSSPHRNVIITICISLSLLFAALLAILSAFFIYSRRKTQPFSPQKSTRTESLRLYPQNTIPSDGSPKIPKLPLRPGVVSTSSEFLYLGTLVNSRAGVDDQDKLTSSSNVGLKIGVSSSSSSHYQKLGSPELKPLPPLPRNNYTPTYRSGEVLVSSSKEDEVDSDTEEEEEFFSPRGSSGRKEANHESPVRVDSSSRREIQGFQGEIFGSRSFNSRTASYPESNSYSPSKSVSSSVSPVSNSSLRSGKSNKSPDTIISFPAPVQSIKRSSSSISSSSSGRNSGEIRNSVERNSGFSGQNEQVPVRIESVSKQFVPVKLPPPPPPPPPPRFWEMPVGVRMAQKVNLGSSGPPVLVLPARPVLVQDHAMQVLANEQMQSNGSGERNEESMKPKLKPLHWDKVRASSDRAMVWDQIKSSSFQ